MLLQPVCFLWCSGKAASCFPFVLTHRLEVSTLYCLTKKIKMFWTLSVLTLVTLANCQETCLSSDDDPNVMFGSKTAYTFANKGLPINKAHEIPGCQPIAIWLLERPGSNTPEVNEIGALQQLNDLRNNIVANYRNGNFRNTNVRMCAADVNLLERWEWNPRQNNSFAGDLTSDGYVSTVQLAQAWKRKFPGLLTDNRHDYLFKYPNDQRSTTTFRAFTEGLFRSQASVYDVPKDADETVLQPYKHCPTWTRDVEENNDTLSQLHIFEAKQEFREMLSNISRRLGFNYDVTRPTVQSMYEMCRYNKAWDVAQISPWCAVFSKEDLKMLEYAEDLETYYKYGYGTPLNQQIGCTSVKDMMDFFKMHVENETPQQPRARVLVAEAPTLALALAALGSHRDSSPLTANDYRAGVGRGRQWTTSTMTPFNGNLAATLYKCTPNGNFQVNEIYQVLFMENEKPLYLEGCRVGLCDWSFVKTRFGLIGDNCNLNFCNSANKVSSFVALSLVITIITTTLHNNLFN